MSPEKGPPIAVHHGVPESSSAGSCPTANSVEMESLGGATTGPSRSRFFAGADFRH